MDIKNDLFHPQVETHFWIGDLYLKFHSSVFSRSPLLIPGASIPTSDVNTYAAGP